MAEGTRLAETLAALSLASDLGTGAPLERGLRSVLVMERLAALAGLPAADRRDLYQASFLIMLGCTSGSAHDADLFGDELELGRGMSPLVMGSEADSMRWLIGNLGAGQPPLRRVGRIAGVLSQGRAHMQETTAGHCEVAERMAERLGLGQGVAAVLRAVFERWDGKGRPAGLKGEEVPLGNRVGAVAYDIVSQLLVGQTQAEVLGVLRRHAGHGLDPALVELVGLHAGDVFDALAVPSAWDAVLAAEPEPLVLVGEGAAEVAAEVVADFADLKSRFTRGHSRGVAALAEAGARAAGVPEAEVTRLRRAALTHDLGRVTVSAGVWEKAGPLTDGEWEQVRLHAHWSERVLSRTSAFGDVGTLAGMHHERLDGSGYHRGAAAAGLNLSARLLAAADVCQALAEERPHRPAFALSARQQVLADEVLAGRLDADSVRWVAEAAGLPGGARPEAPAGLTDRELQVLRLIARGSSTKQVARQLSMATKTADHHIQSVYDKIGVRTRAGAALYAMERGLLVG